MALGGRWAVALDASGVAGARLSVGRGRVRVRAWARAPLSPGALEPGGVEPNLARPDEVREALSRVARELGCEGRPACLLLPAGVARTALVDRARGVEPAELVLFRIASRLPYPAEEALVDGTGKGESWLAGVVRRSVVAQYEAVAAEAGIAEERVDVAPLAGLTGLLRSGAGDRGIDVVLGDAAVTVAVRGGGSWTDVRSRRRPRTEADVARVADTVERLCRRDVGGGRPPVRLVGPGADAAAETLRQRGHRAEAGWPGFDGPEAAREAPWLGGLA